MPDPAPTQPALSEEGLREIDDVLAVLQALQADEPDGAVRYDLNRAATLLAELRRVKGSIEKLHGAEPLLIDRQRDIRRCRECGLLAPCPTLLAVRGESDAS